MNRTQLRRPSSRGTARSTLARTVVGAALWLPLVAGCAKDKAADASASASTSASTAAAPAAGADSAANSMANMPGMAGMSGMSGMDTPVTIPKGAIYTAADVHFMQGMIAHHAQAIFMSRLAASHGANPKLQKFANKIDQSQMAEIKLMQDWLRANKQTAPDTSSYHHVMMSGMLTADQIKQLEAAKGAEFDRLFLTFMIQHHEGALKMVDDLNASPGAAQDIDVSVFANDVTTVQTAEIGTMHRMLDALSAKP